MMYDHLCPQPDPQVASTIVDGQAVVVMTGTGQITVLNDVGSRIWELCDGSRSISELITIISDEYEVDAEQARLDVNSFLDRLIHIQAIVLLPPR